MIVFVNTDPITVMNHVNANHPDWSNRVSVVLGVTRARGRDDKLFVFDSLLVVDAMTERPLIADENGKVDWTKVSAYMSDTTVKVPTIKVVPNRIVNELANKEIDPDHALSAMSSVFRHDLRPQVMAEIVKFLTDANAKTFTLPGHLTPQRGKVKALYDKAAAHDYTKLKAAIRSTDESYFEATYWRAKIKSMSGEPKPAKRRAQS